MMYSSKHSLHTFRPHESGIALLVAIIFMSVVLAIGLSLSSFGYKQIMLVSSVTDSQAAFYAADSALECVLYADQHNAVFNKYSIHYLNPVKCDGTLHTISKPKTPRGSTWQVYTLPMLSFPSAFTSTCALVKVYKSTSGETYIFATGYNNNNCAANNKTTVRGIETHYGG